MVDLTSDTHLDDQEQAPVSEEVLPLVEDIAIVGKRSVLTGRLRVHLAAGTAEEIAHAQVQRESVEVTRIPVDRIVETTPEIKTEGELTIVPVLEEARCREAPCPQGRTAYPASRRSQDNRRARHPAQAARHCGAACFRNPRPRKEIPR